SERLIAGSGAMAIHAYDQVETMLGQGSVGLEIEEDAPDVETLLVSVGGGGLIGGIAAWYENRVKVIAVESDGAPTLRDAFVAGPPGGWAGRGISPDRPAPHPIRGRALPIARPFVAARVSLLPAHDSLRSARA